ncbi:MAG TPA: DUF503 domain-containing protein [Candidatus Aminicenantes bacterium]|nr:DUF503 domain-containing protein [Candidatus Aminicenantes bacterium]
MTVGLMVLDFACPGCHSLKDKRRALTSFRERLRSRFNVAVIESGHQEAWQEAQLAVAGVAESRPLLDRLFQQIDGFAATDPELLLTGTSVEYR